MKLERAGRAAFVLGVSAAELSSLIAAVRIAADVLEADDRTRPRRPPGSGRFSATTSVPPPASAGQISGRGTGLGARDSSKSRVLFTLVKGL